MYYTYSSSLNDAALYRQSFQLQRSRVRCFLACFSGRLLEEQEVSKNYEWKRHVYVYQVAIYTSLQTKTCYSPVPFAPIVHQRPWDPDEIVAIHQWLRPAGMVWRNSSGQALRGQSPKRYRETRLALDSALQKTLWWTRAELFPSNNAAVIALRSGLRFPTVEDLQLLRGILYQVETP